MSSPKKNASPAKKGDTSDNKKQTTEKEKKSEAEKIGSPRKQKGLKRKGKMVELSSDSYSYFIREKKMEKMKKINKCRYVILIFI